MDDEYEIEGIDICHAIEDEHCLYSEVPRAGAIGRGDNHGYCAYDESHQGTTYPEVFSEVETEKRQVIVEEITEPDT